MLVDGNVHCHGNTNRAHCARVFDALTQTDRFWLRKAGKPLPLQHKHSGHGGGTQCHVTLLNFY